MSKLSFTYWLRQTYRQASFRKVTQSGHTEGGGCTLIFSPHQDDETLACGGTIINKTNRGMTVKIVFMTDGRNSHRHSITPDEMKNIRRCEALAASGVLGVKKQNVIFLEFEDGRLIRNEKQAVERVNELLLYHTPQEIFIPYGKEPMADHCATNKIVLSALEQYQKKATIFEYPVWFWYHWPWVSLKQQTPPGTLSVLKNTLVAGLGWQLVRSFRYAVNIRDVLAYKQLALNQYESQMTRLNADPNWITLRDISKGEFIACFFQDYEIFRRYVWRE